MHFLCSCLILLVCCSVTEPVENEELVIDFDQPIATGSPLVFGATQPRGLYDANWDTLKAQGVTFARSQANLTRLVPCDSPEEYYADIDGCADPENWDWQNGVYGDNFAQRAIDRGMAVCFTIKNARWNRYPGAPDDEETMPRDLDVWADIITKIVNHYKGGLTFVEMFNEVDRDPQFHVEGSPYTRKTGYQKAVYRALAAVKTSRYPETPVGGPASAMIGEEQIEWLLSDDQIRPHLGCITFHDFDNPEYPREGVQTIKKLMKKYGVDLPIVRSSHVPEFNRNQGMPGTLVSVYEARMLIGALKDGLAAQGLWEVQHKSGGDDVRYWFDGDSTVNVANLYRMMSKTLGLGRGESRVVRSQGDFTEILGAVNVDGVKIAVIAAVKANQLTLKFNGVKAPRALIYRADHGYDGKTVLNTINLDDDKTITLTCPKESVFGLKFE